MNPSKQPFYQKLDFDYRRWLQTVLLIVGLLSDNATLQAQGYIDCATILNEDNYPELYTGYGKSIYKDGYLYVGFSVGHDFEPAPRLPVINGDDYHITDQINEYDVYFAIFDDNCNQILGTYIGGERFDILVGMEVDADGNIVLMGYAKGSSDFFTTDGTAHSGVAEVPFVRKYAPDGTIIFSTIFGGNSDNDIFPQGLVVDGTDIYTYGFNSASDFPSTNGTTFSGGSSDIFAFKMDGAGNLQYANTYGGSSAEDANDGLVLNGNLYLTGFTLSLTDFPTTDGSTSAGYYEAFVTGLDSSGNVIFNTLYGGSSIDYGAELASDGTYLYVLGQSRSTDFLTTDGSTYVGGVDDDITLRKYDLSGNMIYSKLFGSSVSESVSDIQIVNGLTYVLFRAGADFSVTMGTYSGGTYDLVLMNLDANGNVLYSTFYGGTSNFYQTDFVYVNSAGETYLVFEADNAPTTDGTTASGTTFAKFNANGSLCMASTLPNGSNGSANFEFEVVGDTIWYVGSVNAGDGGASTDGTQATVGDVIITKFVFCPAPTPIASDLLMPNSQMICQNAIVDQIIGEEQIIDGATFPQIYTDGVLGDQRDIELVYQWQVSTTASGPWSDITGALAKQKNYSPPPTTTNQYYQRLTKTAECCGNTLVSTSDVASVLVSGDIAPTVDAGGTFYTCTGGIVTIGGSPSATGGTTPYSSYVWNEGAFTGENPSVSPTESSVYTLVVTDANGCMQTDQATVTLYNANAGLDKDVCDGASTTIGGAPLAGVTIVPSGGTPPANEYSIEYAWLPTAGLSCSDCPNPSATPGLETTYTLTVTLNDKNGSTCQTTDMVTVGIITAPPTVLTIPDTVICLGEEIELSTLPAALGTPPTIAAVSQSSVSTTATVANLSDGILDSYAGRTNDGVAEFIKIDFGSVETISKIKLAARGSDYNFIIEVSTDDVTYTNLGFEVGYSSGTPLSRFALTPFAFSPTDVRYVRMSSIDASKDVDISEFVAVYDYTYIWTPGQYITTDGVSAIFDAGNLEMPANNPITYTLSATLGVCTFYEQVSVAVIEARAGDDFCGPRMVGKADRTPNIEETYSWVRITDPGITTGTGDFLGVTNEAIVPVSASVGGDVGYELTTSFTFNGSMTMCRDTVIVPPTCGGGCDIITADGGCPSFDNGTPTLVGIPPNSDAAANWTYSWTSNEGMVGLDNYTNQEVTLTDNVNRTYYVTFTTVLDPSFTCVHSIFANSASFSTPVFNPISPVAACPGTMVNIGDPATNPGLSYAWSNASSLDDATISYPVVTLSASTEFTVTVTDIVTGCRAVDTVQVDIPQVASAGQDINVCDNGIITIGGNTPLAGYTYVWEPAGADWRNGTDENDAQPDVFVATAQDFYLAVTDPTSTCVSRDTVSVTVEPLPPAITLPNLSFCPSQVADLVLGTNDGTTGGTNLIPGGYNYAWSPSNVSDTNIANPTVNTPLPTNSVTYEITYSAPNGCNQKVTQTVTQSLTAPVVSFDKTICLGEITTIGDDVNPTGGGITYSWDPTTDLNDATAPNPIYTGNVLGSTTFTVTKSDGVCSTTAEVTITVNEATAPTLTPQNICAGESIQIGTTAQSGLSYDWSPSTSLDNANIANPTFNGTTSTNYTLTVINGNGCREEATTSVIVNPPSTHVVTVPDVIICDANATSIVINASVAPGGNYAYQWSPTTYLSNPSALTPTFFIPAAGTYEYMLEVIDQTTGCSVFETTVMEVILNVPHISNISGVNPTTCSGTDGSISLTLTNVPDGTYTINYMDGVPSAQTFTNVMVTGGSATISSLSAGTYNDLSIIVSECMSAEDVDLTLSDPDIPTLAANPTNPTTCMGTDGQIALTLTNVPDGTYTINYMDATPAAQTFTNVMVTGGAAMITGLNAGTYDDLTITVAGCTSTENVDLTLIDPNGPTLSTNPTAESCVLNDGSIELTATGGASPFDISWSDVGTNMGSATNETSPYTITNLSPANYGITVTDDNGCSSTTTETVVAATNCCPAVTNPTLAQTICQNETIATLQVTTDATAPEQIEFVYFTTAQSGNAMYSGGTSQGIVTQSAGMASISAVNFPASGTYYVYAIISPIPADVNCRPYQEIQVIVNALPDITLMVSDSTVCDETAAFPILSSSEVGFNYQLRNDADDSPIGSPVAGTGNPISFTIATLTPVGTYTYNVFASNPTTGCSAEITDKAVIEVVGCDYQDYLPTCANPPCHITSADIYIGSGVSSEASTQGSLNADLDDDDGILIPNNIRPSITIRFPTTIYNNTGQPAYLTGWIDWNGDQDFDDPGEQIANEIYDYATYNGTFQVPIIVQVPSNAVQSQDIAVRYRLSTNPADIISPCGISACAVDGEIEDYLIQVECPPVICLPVQITINRGE